MSFLRIAIVILIVFAAAVVIFLPEPNLKQLSSQNLHTAFQVEEIPSPFPKPVRTLQSVNAPEISARSAIVIDAKTGDVLFEKDPDIRHLPASTTKLMTAIVALERCSPDTPVIVSQVQKEGTQMGLAPGDLITAGNLLYGLLMASGNDAAYALAYACSDSYDKFLDFMNQKAKELGMNNSHFVNPAGFDDDLQYSCARDLAKLAKVASANPLISKIVATKSTVVTDIGGNKTYYLNNINKLLGEVPGLEGVKTGQTEGSLEILLTKTTRESNTIIAAVLGSHDRFGESKNLIEWTFANHEWVSR